MRSPEIGDLICGWRIVEEEIVGRVGRAFVVRKDVAPDRTFVLKLQRGDLPDDERNTNRRESALLRIGMAKTPDRMPALIEEGEWNGLPFFVMERIEPIDYPIADGDYRDFCVETFCALGELHDWLLHCDLTPSHIGRKNGKIAFIDFDSAHTPTEALSNDKGLGTDPYIAPEVASRGRLSVQSDMYALATILLERCPKKQRDCFDPVLRECLRPEGERPASAAVFANSLRTCKPPHHRFKAVVRWTMIAALAYGAVASISYHVRRASIRARHNTQIDADTALRVAQP